MDHNLKQLLDALDHATGKLASLVNSLGEVPLNWAKLEEPIQWRAAQIEHLNDALTASGPIGDAEYNRLVAIHREGEQISSSLQAIRNQLVFQTTARTAQHAYRHCLEGMVPAAPGTCVDTA
ncbi:MAG TPA: hypothetical protein VH351_12350 [Bryobacteraceae bacterium]|jgi:hypothetical protein|nr:hypothetical protein [Bryobacteraceae bacterium]